MKGLRPFGKKGIPKIGKRFQHKALFAYPNHISANSHERVF